MGWNMNLSEILMFRNFSLNRLLVMLTAAGFLFLLIDSTLEHWDILTQDLLAFIPIIFSAFGLFVTAITVWQWNEYWIKRLHILLFVTLLIAPTGLYFHIIEEEDEELATTEEREHEAKEKDKPPLAPLSFGGLAAVGLLGTSRRWKADVVEPTD